MWLQRQGKGDRTIQYKRLAISDSDARKEFNWSVVQAA